MLCFLPHIVLFFFCNGISSRFQNMSLMFGLNLGFCLIPWMYIVEYNARFLCPRDVSTVYDYETVMYVYQ